MTGIVVRISEIVFVKSEVIRIALTTQFLKTHEGLQILCHPANAGYELVTLTLRIA